MRDAVHGLVGHFGGQVVEQQHGGAELREIMLERQDLPAVAQRTLRQQPDLGQAVEDDAVGLERSTASKICFVVSPSSRSDE